MSEDFNDDLNTPTEDDLEKCYGSKYLLKTRILKITKEPMQQQGGKPERPKLVLYLSNIDKGMVLNATNKNALVAALGKNPANWKGAEIGLYTEPTQFQGKSTRGLRLKVLSVPKAGAKPAAAPKPKSPKPAAAEELPPPWPDEPGDPGPESEFTEAAE